MRVCMHARTRDLKQACVHACTLPAPAHPSARRPPHSCMPTRLHARPTVRACMRARTHAPTHTQVLDGMRQPRSPLAAPCLRLLRAMLASPVLAYPHTTHVAGRMPHSAHTHRSRELLSTVRTPSFIIELLPLLFDSKPRTRFAAACVAQCALFSAAEWTCAEMRPPECVEREVPRLDS